MIKVGSQYFESEEAYRDWLLECENVKLSEACQEAYSNKNYDEAVRIGEILVGRGFDGTAAYRTLCDVYHKQGKYKDEIRVIKCLRKVTPKARYKEGNKYRWYDKRYDELTTNKE